ncbi:MAG: 23S rRNA (uracil(1939)-C(5))-methyltransferase RlmD [Oscillospiraceae bacterium]|jgi:23S rRNA (uracil1939-C5)-methyltransferase|nr:23S rRNA (uracil(1939)-C(5))-methyltransferase RlmD [Oscillospiraceae bacterium]
MNKNDTIELTVTGASGDGNGVAHAPDGRVVFVAGALIGERVTARILKPGKNALWAKATEILEASSERIAPECPYFPRCGGCDYLHMSYREELRLKLERVNDAFVRIGKISLTADRIVHAESRSDCRNKAIYNLANAPDGVKIGFYQERSHRVIGIDRCMLQSDFSARTLTAVRDWISAAAISVYDEAARKGLIRKIFTRGTQIVIVANGKPRSVEELTAAVLNACPECTSVLWNELRGDTNAALGDRFYTLYGELRLSVPLCGLRFLVSPDSFFQVNVPQAERLYELALNLAELSAADTALDLYCGIGTLTLLLAKRCASVTGIEISRAAIDNAAENAALNAVTNAQFVCADLNATQELPPADAVFLDPPRKGLPPELIGAIAAANPGRVIYISCDPATLARDLKLFSEHGYTADRAECVDMFPCTHHVETVVRLNKNSR